MAEESVIGLFKAELHLALELSDTPLSGSHQDSDVGAWLLARIELSRSPALLPPVSGLGSPPTTRSVPAWQY